MTKTLADMTAEERADCVGMWAKHAHPHYDGLEVIIDSDHDSVTTISTKSGQQYIVVGEVMRHITPRFDLPRAWTPDGEPEIEQALAEETYFYGVQVWMGGRWIMMLTRDHGTSLMHRGKWFEHKHEAEECAAKWNHDTPTRIVRQRRSPVEVINE